LCASRFAEAGFCMFRRFRYREPKQQNPQLLAKLLLVGTPASRLTCCYWRVGASPPCFHGGVVHFYRCLSNRVVWGEMGRLGTLLCGSNRAKCGARSSRVLATFARNLTPLLWVIESVC
jgi:hypothetical protein